MPPSLTSADAPTEAPREVTGEPADGRGPTEQTNTYTGTAGGT